MRQQRAHTPRARVIHIPDLHSVCPRSPDAGKPHREYIGYIIAEGTVAGLA